MQQRTDADDELGRPLPSAVFGNDDPSYNVANADWSDAFAPQRSGLTAKAEAAGFSPVRFHKGRSHTLEVDPRTKLRIVNVPAERRVAFADLQDVVIHVFLDCFKITSGEQYTERVFIVTDQTMFLCTKEGAVGRCVMVEQIRSLFVSKDTKALGLQVPSEYDLLVKFQNASDRDRVIKVLRTVYRRVTHNRLAVEMIKEPNLDPSKFKIKKPPNFRLAVIPQRTKEQLRQALEVFEREEEAVLEELDLIQDEMETKHNRKMQDLQAQIENDLGRVRNIVKEVWDNEETLKRRREEVAKGRRLIEQIDGPFSTDGELPVSKDAKIAELELVVARLNAAVYASGSDAGRRDGQDAASSTYFRSDLQNALYAPSWPGTGQPGAAAPTGDLTSLTTQLQERLALVNRDIAAARDAANQAVDSEAKMRVAEERINYLRHAQRTGRTTNEKVAAGGLVGASRAGHGGSRQHGGGGGQPDAAEKQMEAYDQSYAWLSDLPQEITVDTLKVDPRTGLHFVDLPDVIRPYFADAAKAVLHFFAVVRKPTKLGELVKRVVLIGDQALYLCTPNGEVKRCIDVVDIDEILIDQSFGIGFRCHQDYDLTFQCVTGEHRQEIVDILQRLYKFAFGGRAIPVSELPRHQRMDGFLKLVQPPGYVLPFTPFRTRQELVDEVRQKRDVVIYNAPAASSASAQMPSDVNLPKDEYMRLRANVARQMDYEWRQDNALVQLRAQIDGLEKQLRVTTDEAHEIKAQIDSHRCEDGVGLQAGSFPAAPGSGIMPSSGPGTFRPHADGLFFINVEPTIVNCELDVLKVAMTRDFFFTGHTNGFVSVWDATNNSFLRTFREHTGKITGIHAQGLDLITASTDTTVRRWDLGTGQCTAVMSGHKGPVTCLHRENNRLLTGGADRLIQVWDLERGATVCALKGHHSGVRALKFAGDVLVSVEWGWALFWDLRSNRVVRTLRDEYGGINCLDYSEGIAVAGGCGGDITVWDVGQGTGDTIAAHNDDIHCVQLVGKNAVTAGGDYKVRMWDLAAMKSLGVFHESHPYETPSFQMDGKRFIAAQGPFVKVWSK